MGDYGLLVLVIGLVFVLWLIKSIRLLRQINPLKKQVALSTPAGKHSKSGDYVRFSGKLLMPETQEPLNQSKCGYWNLTVQAKFKAKRKKPNKGYETHTPLIYQSDNNDVPFVLANSQLMAQSCVKNHANLLINPNFKTEESKQPPKLESTELHNNKYQSYVTKLLTLKNETPLVMVGKVISTTNNMLMIAGVRDKAGPPFLFVGNESQLKQFVSKKIFQGYLLLVWSLLCSLLISLTVYTEALPVLPIIVTSLLVGVVLNHLVNRVSK